MAKFLLQNATTNTDSGWVGVDECFSRADQQSGNLYVGGTPDGATVTISVRPKGDTSAGVALEGGAFTAAGCKGQALSPDLQVKAALTDAGASTDMTVWLG